MTKKLITFFNEHLPLIFIVVVILLVIYLLRLNLLQQKSNVENFYQDSSSNGGVFNKDTLYIYAAKREVVSCTALLDFKKEGGKSPQNIPIAGLPNFDFSKYNTSNGFSVSIGLPEPTTIHGKLLDYVMSMLTSTDNNHIKYYTVDNAGSNVDPFTNMPYFYNKTSRENISNDEFIGIMKEFFKILTAVNNNTTVRFIRYYRKDSPFVEISEGEDLAKEINNNNVIIFYENINVINFLQVSNPVLFNKYSQYNDGVFKIRFKDPTGMEEPSGHASSGYESSGHPIGWSGMGWNGTPTL
jgi:hypothetical protein